MFWHTHRPLLSFLQFDVVLDLFFIPAEDPRHGRLVARGTDAKPQLGPLLDVDVTHGRESVSADNTASRPAAVICAGEISRCSSRMRLISRVTSGVSCEE